MIHDTTTLITGGRLPGQARVGRAGLSSHVGSLTHGRRVGGGRVCISRRILMKLAVFGATGLTGGLVVRNALAEGRVRSPLPAGAGLVR